jgi:hypothetical protein
MLELDVKIESADLYDYMLRHSYNSASGIIGSCCGALLILFAFGTGQWLYLIFGLIILLYLPCTLFLRSKKQVLINPSFQQPLHYLLDDEGLTISQNGDSVQYKWEEMHKAVSTGRSIILYTSPINATIFPRKQIEENKVAVIEMISTHMPPAKVKIRQ